MTKYESPEPYRLLDLLILGRFADMFGRAPMPVRMVNLRRSTAVAAAQWRQEYDKRRRGRS